MSEIDFVAHLGGGLILPPGTTIASLDSERWKDLPLTGRRFPHQRENHCTMDIDSNSDIMNGEADYYSDYADAAAYYGYEESFSSEVSDYFPEGPGSPLPAERLARKQRVVVRRGGACHSDLLHSAVMASMSSPKEDDGKPGFSAADAQILTSSSGEAGTSPRKRIRRTDKPRLTLPPDHSRNVDENVIATLASLTMSPLDSNHGSSSHHHRFTGDFSRAPPIRRVSRKKSYTSVASGASGDYEDEEFAEFD